MLHYIILHISLLLITHSFAEKTKKKKNIKEINKFFFCFFFMKDLMSSKNITCFSQLNLHTTQSNTQMQ